MQKYLAAIFAAAFFSASYGSAQELERRSLVLSPNQSKYQFEVGVPPGWSISPVHSRNSHTLTNVAPGESRRPTASVRIFVEHRLNHEDALNQLEDFSTAVLPQEKQFLVINGWPAVQITRSEEQPPPDNAAPLEHPVIMRVHTYIAAGDMLISASGTLPANASRSLIREVQDMGKGLAFPQEGNSAKAKEEILKLEATDTSNLKSRNRTEASKEPTKIMLESTPVEITAELGANDRINTNGFGELEVATSPDGKHVVVALQSRRWVSSNDGGATFPNSGTVGVGNGDPSVAWGQSGKFYMAWIDNSANCDTNYRDPVVAPGPAPNGLDCTGIARSDDNGVTFNTNTVNPAVVCIAAAPAGSPPNAGECFPDQEHIAADRWNPGDTADDDQVYSTWRNFMPGSQDAGLVCSSDSGVTWTAPFDIGSPEVFPRITVGSDGFVYVATYNNTGFRLYKFTSCVNGLTLVPGFPVNVGPRDPYQCPFAGHDRCDQNPTSQTVAVSDTNPNHVYYAYANDRGNGTTGDSDIIVRDSLNGGLTWNIIGRIARANENLDARRIMPWLCTTGGDAVVTWWEQRGAIPTDTTDFFGARVGLNTGGDLVPMEEFVLSEAADNWCDIGWAGLTRWGNTDTQTSNAAEACPNQPQLAGQCGDGDNTTPDSGIRCDFSDDDGVTFTLCPQAAGSPSGNDESCLTGGGVPKYGDYNGNACAGGKLFAAWASANAPLGLAGPDTPNNPGVLFEVINLDGLEVPVITVPGSVQFGAVCPVDDILYKELKVCNTGGANLQVDVITSDNPDFAVTVPSSGYPVTISPDFCFPFEVAYTPSGGPGLATLSIPSNDPDRPVIEVDAKATVGAASIRTFIANSGDFGEVCTDLTKDMNLTVQNNGSCGLQIDSVTLYGADAADFELPSGSFNGTLISAGNSLQIPIRFAPDNFSDPNPRTAGVEVASRTREGSTLPPANTPIKGTVPAPNLNLSIANSGNFGAVCKGGFADLDLTLFNQGRCDLTISDITSDNPLFQLPVSIGFDLVMSHDSTFVVPIRFAPEVCDDLPTTGTITVESDSPGEENLEVDVSGVSPCPNLVIDPTGMTGAFAFPATVLDTTGTLGCYSERSTTLRNSGQCPLTISGISATGDDFTVMSPSQFPITLPPGEETLNVSVRFTPKTDDHLLFPGDIEGLLTINSDDPDPGSAALCGEGVAQSGVRMLVTDVSTGLPIVVDEVDSITLKSKGKNTPSPINLSWSNKPVEGPVSVCGNDVSWHVNFENLPSTETTGSKGGKSQYEMYVRDGNLQTSRTFSLGQCEFSTFQMQIQGTSTEQCPADLKAKGESCDFGAECCSGKCTGKKGAKTCN